MNAPVDVLAVLNEAYDWLHRSSESRGDDARAEAVKQVRDAVDELIVADREYDAAVADHKALIRKVAEHGWAELEFDALRNAGDRTARAQMRRDAALVRVGSAS